MTYRDDVEAMQERVRSLETDMHTSALELDEARRLLDEARRRGRLPVLDNIHIAAPCKASWDDMVGDDRARFCGQCDKNVFNLSAMTRPEAEALLIEKEGRLCVRYYQRTDGTIITADCPDGLRRRRTKKRIVAAAFGAMTAVAAAGSLFHRSARMGQHVMMGAPPPPVERTIMGEPAPIETVGKPMPVEMKGRISIGHATMGGLMGNASPEKPHHKKR